MTSYKKIGGGIAPKFSVTVGLQEGYGLNAKQHSADEVVGFIEAHLKKCAAESRPFLTGMVVTGQVVYAWSEGPGKAGSGHEPAAVFSGEKSPLYNSEMSEEDAEKFLNGLASELGSVLGQTRVYVVYNSNMWILQAEKSSTPTGETV